MVKIYVLSNLRTIDSEFGFVFHPWPAIEVIKGPTHIMLSCGWLFVLVTVMIDLEKEA